MDDLISRQAVIDAIKHCECMHIFELQEVIPEINAIPSPQEHDGCKDCRYQDKNNFEMPCFKCKQNYKDLWEREKPAHETDVIKLCTSEEFKQLQQYNISGNKYHLGFANACAWIRDKYREGEQDG